MARKAREILKTRGYSDAELDGMTMLQDARFCQALEAEDAERERLAATNTQLQADIDDTTRWYNDHANPTLQRSVREATEARAEAARLQELLDAETEYGIRRSADAGAGAGSGAGGGNGRSTQHGAPNPNANAGANADPDPRYVPVEVFQQTVDRFGEALAMASDIPVDHFELFGQRLPGGMTGLRKEYQEEIRANRFRGDLNAFWNRKFNVEAKRVEVAQKRQQEHDERLRQEGRDERSRELGNGNPMMMMPSTSRNPFLRRHQAESATGQQGNRPQPWERTPEQRQSDRVRKFAGKVLQGGASAGSINARTA